jgi:hypothetical protein
MKSYFMARNPERRDLFAGALELMIRVKPMQLIGMSLRNYGPSALNCR